MESILIVDDDLVGAQLLATLLQMEGYEVLQPAHWSDLVKDIEEQRPTWIIMDVRLGQRSGFDVLKKIRAHPNTQIARTPVFMMSANDYRMQSKLAGANGFIDKPFHIPALLAAMRQTKEASLKNKKEEQVANK